MFGEVDDGEDEEDDEDDDCNDDAGDSAAGKGSVDVVDGRHRWTGLGVLTELAKSNRSVDVKNPQQSSSNCKRCQSSLQNYS